MTHHYRTRGTCSREITFDLTDGVVTNIRFLGGCNGNTQGVARLAEGRPAEELIRCLRGLDCNGRGTSCPDQLARAVEEALRK
ncbi:MAG: TIGR03905 family TSCPD domain-containing protein [Clostridia bacterium]|nr:TIGR03905 family TSCPD domain-containing protein [Clostridia bacterium]